MTKLAALIIGVLCSIAVFVGTAVTVVGSAGLPIPAVFSWLGLGSVYLGVAVLLAIPALLFVPIRWYIEALW